MSEFQDGQYNSMYEVSGVYVSGLEFSRVENARSERDAMLKFLQKECDKLSEIMDITAVEL